MSISVQSKRLEPRDTIRHKLAATISSPRCRVEELPIICEAMKPRKSKILIVQTLKSLMSWNSEVGYLPAAPL